MGITLGHNQYGKAETRVVRVYRDSDPHELVDYNVSVALVGDFDEIHYDGDNSKCLTTDATKNTVNAYAKEHGEEARQPESFGLALARHFVEDTEPVRRARIKLEMYPWKRLDSGGSPHPHAFVSDGSYVRTATVTYEDGAARIVSGVKDLVLLKTTDSEFHDFLQDRFTILKPTTDRVMATAAVIQWLHSEQDVDWAKSYDDALSTIDRRLRRPSQPGAAADRLGDGQGAPREPAGDCRDALLDAEQASLRRRSRPRTASTTRTRSSMPTTGRTA